MHDIPPAALQRFFQLQDEQRQIESLAQIGTSIPNLIGHQDTFLVNPSNVGIGVLSRMIETDETISAGVQFKMLMVLSKIGEYHHKDKNIKQFVQDALKNMRGPTWIESQENGLSKEGYGFSIGEIIWELKDNMQKVPTQIVPYHPSTIAFEVDAAGNITEDGIIQFVQQHSQSANPNRIFSTISHGFEVRNPFTTPTDRLMPRRIPFLNSFSIVRIPRDKVIHSVNMSGLSFGSPYGKSPVRTAHLCWQLKVFLMKHLGISGKRFSDPLLWGTAPHGAAKVESEDTLTGKKEKLTPAQALLKIMAARQNDDAIITGPKEDGWNIEAITGEGSFDKYINVINAIDVWMLRSFLMPSLVMTDGTAGSRSLGDKHFQMIDRICESDAHKYSTTLINDFVRRIIEENFGPMDDNGEFKPRPQNLAERQALASMFTELIMSGVMKPFVKDDMIFMRDSLGLPEDKEPGFAIVGGDKIDDKGNLTDASKGEDGALPPGDKPDEPLIEPIAEPTGEPPKKPEPDV